MFKINSEKAIKIIMLFSLINSSVFLAFDPGTVGRLFIVTLMNLSVLLLFVSFYKLFNWQSEAIFFIEQCFCF